jgi:hypothetical protein
MKTVRLPAEFGIKRLPPMAANCVIFDVLAGNFLQDRRVRTVYVDEATERH